jgi:hypothetical protein
MRGKDVKPGMVVAVVGSRSPYPQDDAIRAVVVGLHPEGGFLCRFDEPMLSTPWSVRPAGDKKVPGQNEQILTERAFDSRHLIAEWDDYRQEVQDRKDAQEALQKRLAYEQERIGKLNETLQAVLAKKGADVDKCAFSYSSKQVDEVSHRCAQLQLTAATAEKLAGLRASRGQEQARVERALVPIKEQLLAVGLQEGDKRFEAGSMNRYEPVSRTFNQYARLIIPLEVMEAWVPVLDGKRVDDGPSALAALLSPMLDSELA